ncbi:MAG: twin-arginine translocation signal domain-containing protein [Nitrososphaerales archaeon]
MSLALSRRDAIKGAMAATAALAAAPYIGTLSGGVRASPAQNAPATAAGASAGTGAAASRDAGTTVLVIKGDTVSSHSGFQTINVKDAALASRLRSAVQARFD